MRGYIFEEEWANNIDRRFMYIKCKNIIDDKVFTVLIDTYDDPYFEFYGGSYKFTSDNAQKIFREQLFDYLEEKYPDSF